MNISTAPQTAEAKRLTERKLFEKSLRAREYHYFDGKLMGPEGGKVWEYLSAGTQHAWQGWQAARDLASSADSPVGKAAPPMNEAQIKLGLRIQGFNWGDQSRLADAFRCGVAYAEGHHGIDQQLAKVLCQPATLPAVEAKPTVAEPAKKSVAFAYLKQEVTRQMEPLYKAFGYPNASPGASLTEPQKPASDWYERHQDACTKDYGEYNEDAPLAARLRWWVPKSARHGRLLLEDDLLAAVEALSNLSSDNSLKHARPASHLCCRKCCTPLMCSPAVATDKPMTDQILKDRKLLELAGKAAGYEIRLVTEEYHGPCQLIEHLPLESQYFSIQDKRWDPINNDGDALRLGVKLQLGIAIGTECSWSHPLARIDPVMSWTENHDKDPYAATRRAIVRAAAQIGLSLSQQISPAATM